MPQHRQVTGASSLSFTVPVKVRALILAHHSVSIAPHVYDAIQLYTSWPWMRAYLAECAVKEAVQKSPKLAEHVELEAP